MLRYLLAAEEQSGPVSADDVEIAERILNGELDEWPA